MVLVVGFASCVDAGDIGGLFVIDPHSAHGVVHAGENLHGRDTRIVADKFFVNFENAFQLAVENLAVDVGEVEVDHRLAVDAEVELEHYFENRAGSHVARNEVAVFRIPLFEEIPALTFRNGVGIALVALRLRYPDASTFAAGRFRHETQLVFAGDAGGMHLNELSVRVVAALLIERGLRRSRAHHGIRRLAKDGANATRGNDDGVGGEGADFHRPQIHRANAAADAASVEHGGEKFPVLVLLHFAVGFVAPDLLIEGVEKLLAGGGSGEGGAVIERATEAAEIEQTFGRAIEGHAHAVEQIDNAGSGLAHGLDRRLVGEEVAAINRVVEMFVGRIALALQVLGGVDASLRAHRVRALYGDNREQVNLTTHLGDLDDGGQAGEAAAHYDNFWSCHAV